MGNYFSSTQSYFLCVVCNTPFLREMSGSLLCKECRVNSEFDKLLIEEKESLLDHFIIYPNYYFLKDKKPILQITDNFEPNFYRNINSQIKSLSQHPRYRLIKSIIRYLDQSHSFIHKASKGIYFYSQQTNDILFIRHKQIQDDDRVIYFDFDRFVAQLKKDVK
jgi:hypothetical protein